MHPRIEQCYQDIGWNNPLRKLSEELKVHLFSQLIVYGELERHDKPQEDPSNYQISVDEAHEVAREANALADRIDSLLQEGWNWKQLHFMTPYRILPWMLRHLSSNLGFFARMIAKPRKLDSVLATQMLLTASEFVKINTGSFNDEHLVDLVQQMYPFWSDELAGDTIRKRRDRFKADYPEHYRRVRDHAKRMSLHSFPLGSGDSK